MSSIDQERTELEARLAKAKSQRAAVAQAKAQDDELEALRAAVEAEERAARDDEAIAAAVVEYGPVGRKIAVVETDLGVIILKRAHPAAFKKFQDGESSKTEALDKLTRPCRVYPDVDAYDHLLEELPATLTRCADAVVALAGARRTELTGKS